MSGADEPRAEVLLDGEVDERLGRRTCRARRRCRRACAPTRSRLRSSATSRMTKSAGVHAGRRACREHVEARRRACARSAGSASAASFCSLVGSDSTGHQPGMTRNMMLRWSSVQLMSIGRVCTCGHTRAPSATSRSTAAITWSRAVGRGVAVEQRRQRGGDAVAAADSSPSISTRVTVRPASKNSWTICSIRPRSPSTAHSASSSSCSAKRHGTGSRSSSMSTKLVDRPTAPASRHSRRTSHICRDLARRSRRGGRRRPSRTGAARSGRRAGRR